MGDEIDFFGFIRALFGQFLFQVFFGEIFDGIASCRVMDVDHFIPSCAKCFPIFCIEKGLLPNPCKSTT